MNEWVTDGVNRMRIAEMTNDGDVWTARVDVQTTQESVEIATQFQGEKILAVREDGSVIDPVKDPFQKTTIDSSRGNGYSTFRGSTGSTTFVLQAADQSTENPPAKLILQPVASALVKGSWTFDLTCKK